MSLWLKVAALMVLLVAAVAVQSWRLSHAQQLADQQAQTLTAQHAALTEQASQLKSLADLAERNNAEQARLRSLAADTQEALTERQKTLARLQRENEALKRWADT
ncbi:LysB family phage lysis regulatory protein, partial [Dickeya dianthicola]|nr:LysB family phage lysis regulatory protein [Dickeya dianthicola]